MPKMPVRPKVIFEVRVTADSPFPWALSEPDLAMCSAEQDAKNMAEEFNYSTL